MTYTKLQRGFTLLEIALVLIVLGLIVGGVMTGNNLIQNAKMQAIAKEKSVLVAAVSSFKDKYYSLPGDFKAASNFWGDLSLGCVTFNVDDLVSGSCNGDGDTTIRLYERLFAWQHLAFAGLMPYGYSGNNSGGGYAMRPGQNYPGSEWSDSSGWMINYILPQTSDGTYFAGVYGNTLILGDTGLDIGNGEHGVMTPDLMLKFDVKYDDGEPATGDILSMRTTFVTDCVDAGGSEAYMVDEDTSNCAILWRDVF